MRSFFVILFFSGSLFAQDLQKTFSPLSEGIIYQFLGEVNPGIKTSHTIANLAADVLSEWVDAITTIDTTKQVEAFMTTDKSYVIVRSEEHTSEPSHTDISRMPSSA